MLRYALQELRKKDDTLKQEEKLLKKAKREMAEEELSVIRKKYVLKDAICPALKNLSMHQKATLKQKFERGDCAEARGEKNGGDFEPGAAGVDAVARVFAEGTKAWMEKE
jgi:DNA repair ATPase RecN